jgi:hypothetical protein
MQEGMRMNGEATTYLIEGRGMLIKTIKLLSLKKIL